MTASWFHHPLVLKGRKAELWPLEEDLLDTLFAVARDPALWRMTSADYSDRALFDASFRTALRERPRGTVYPFVVRLAGEGPIVGTTRLLEIQPNDRKLEIGVTWLARACWGTGVNLECKQLLLTHCFEVLRVNRVQFRAKAGNGRSRRALEKIGAVFEGVLRQDKIEPGGRARDTAFYSIVRAEWPGVKALLADRLAALQAAPGQPVRP